MGSDKSDTKHQDFKQRRVGNSIHNVDKLCAQAREVQKEKGLTVMMEFITIKPITLKFSKKETEDQFLIAHSEKYRYRYRPLMIVVALAMVLVGIQDIYQRCYYKLIAKIPPLLLSIFCGLMNFKIYDRDTVLAVTSALLVYLILLARVIQEGKNGNIYIEAGDPDVAVVFLMFIVLGVIIGLRFIITIMISLVIVILSLLSIWLTPYNESTSSRMRFEASGFVLLGYYVFNIVLIRSMEVQERRDYRLTKRLAAENVHVQMEMENFTLFSRGVYPRSPDSVNSAVAPGGVLSNTARIAISDITMQEAIGCGSFADVLKGKWKGTTIAIKKLRGKISENVMKEFGAESALMADLRHPHLVMFMGICLCPPMIIMEYCKRGSLFNVIHVEKIAVDWTLVLRLLLDAAEGMNFLHQHDPPIVHHDLKSLNLLLDENWRCKVSDFGMSKLKHWKTTKSEGEAPLGSIPWMAPEVTYCDKVTEKADVYSFGIIIFELLKRNMPYRQLTMQSIPFLVSQGRRPTDFEPLRTLPDSLEPVAALMKQCWSHSPDARPDFETIVESLEKDISPKYCNSVNWRETVVFPRDQMQATISNPLGDMSFNIREADLDLGPKIGGGSYGTVFSGRWLGTQVAIKQITITAVPEKALHEFHKECDLMRQMRHPNVVLFMGSTAQPPNLFLVTELLSKGSLFDIYHSESQPNELIQQHRLAVKVASDMARGMAYLHSLSPPLIHRDLKSPNIMVDANWISKIGDFGLSRLKDETKTMTKCGSPLWVAPEVLQGLRFAEGCDIYSFAIITWEIIAWSEPYPEMGSRRVMKEVALKDLRPTIPSSCPESLKTLLESCWQKTPSKRPPFQRILQMLERIEDLLGNTMD